MFLIPLRLRIAGLLLLASGIYALASGHGNTQQREAGLLVAIIGLGVLAFSLRGLVGLGPRRRELKWEKTFTQAADESRQGNYQGAEQKFRQAVDQAGPAPRRLKADQQIASVLISQKRPQEAIGYLRDALTIRERGAKPDDRSVGEMRLRLADLYLDSGFPAHARPILEKQVATNTLVSGARRRIAEADVMEGNLDAAEALFSVLLADLTRTKGEWDLALAEPLIGLGGIALDRHDYSRAEQHLNRALACGERVGNTDLAQRARLGLVQVYAQDDRPAQAAELLDRYVNVATSRQGLSMAASAPLMRDRAELLRAAGKTEDADRILRRAQVVQEVAERRGDAKAALASTGSYRESWRRSAASPIVGAPPS